MARKKSLESLSAEELYALAEKKQLEEAEKEREAAREQLSALRAERREMIAEHKKALAALDKKIRKLGGKTSNRGRSSSINVTDTVLKIVEAAGEISTKEIKEKLDAQGITASNLSQTLAYLKRQEKVVSTARSVYAPA